MGKPKAAPQTSPRVSLLRRFAGQTYWLLPFLLFLVLRLFSGDPYYLLGGDQCTFLELARTFPRHQLFDHELYLIHSPVFGYAIGLLHLALPLLTSGLAAVLAFACAGFFAILCLGRFERLPPAAICLGLIYLAVSRPAVAYDYHVARVSIMVCSNALALLAFRRMLDKGNGKRFAQAIAANVFALLVSDQGLLLLPCEVVLFLASGSFWHWKRVGTLAVASLAAGTVWPLVRLIEYQRHSDLAAGISGTIEFTRNFPLSALLQPNFLPFTNTHRSLFTQTSLSLANLKFGPLTALPIDLLMIPGAVSALLAIGLIIAALSQAGRRKDALVWLGLSLLFLLPVGMGMNEWYGMGFIVPFSLLMMEGAAAVTGWAGKTLTIALPAVCLLGCVMWLGSAPPAPHSLLSPSGGADFLFARAPVTRGASLARFFDPQSRDTGIMAPTDLSPELAYLTDKRVMALPFDPSLLDRFIAEYRVTYIVISSEFLRRYQSPVADQYTSSKTVRYVAEHPERYKLVYKSDEQYPAFYAATEYYVLQTVQ